MKLYTLSRKQLLPISLDKAWAFFSSPKNLPKITPPYMSFNVTSTERLETMYAGQVITYIVKPVLGIPMRWATEISHVEDKKYFVDEQRFGPYAFWHHQHWFEQTPEGIVMQDLVHYGLPLGILGRIANWLFVKRQLTAIFDYRIKAVDELLASGKLK